MNTKGLSAWGLTMMALGTVIGGSFFLGSAIAIRAAGPGIIVSYVIGGVLVYLILFSLSEMTVANNAPGSFRTYAEQAFGPGAGFVTGWVYWTGLVLAMSSEATAAAILIREWIPGVSLAGMGFAIITAVTLANLLGARHLVKLESALSFVKIFAIIGFIVLAIAIIAGFMPNRPPVGWGALGVQPVFPGGISGIAGSMLIVMFTYAGFEVIGLAASETSNPHKIVPRAILYTVVSLVSLYVLAIALLLPLIPTTEVTGDVSPMVLALIRVGIGWAANLINIVLITAILSTMLAATFGLGRMISSLASEGHAPAWIHPKGNNIPMRGILFSGLAMAIGLSLTFILPRQVYLFLVSSGGFALLFTYIVILGTHYRIRKQNGCQPQGKCQLPGFPYTSWFAIISLIAVIASMPLVPGQGTGLAAGVALVLFYMVCYLVKRLLILRKMHYKGIR